MIGIDLQNRKPIYEQIIERFQTLIVNGVLEPDSQMPSVRSLAMELSINPNTIQKAYSALEQEGYIYPVKGRGNFVSGNAGLKLQKQEGVYRELRELVERGKELGISCGEFTQRAERYYREGQQRQTQFIREGRQTVAEWRDAEKEKQTAADREKGNQMESNTEGGANS